MIFEMCLVYGDFLLVIVVNDNIVKVWDFYRLVV